MVLVQNHFHPTLAFPPTLLLCIQRNVQNVCKCTHNPQKLLSYGDPSLIMGRLIHYDSCKPKSSGFPEIIYIMFPASNSILKLQRSVHFTLCVFTYSFVILFVTYTYCTLAITVFQGRVTLKVVVFR